MEGVNSELIDKMKWFAKGSYAVVKDGEKIRFYNLQVDMRGIVDNGDTKAPTVGYFEIRPQVNGGFEFSSGAHPRE